MRYTEKTIIRATFFKMLVLYELFCTCSLSQKCDKSAKRLFSRKCVFFSSGEIIYITYMEEALTYLGKNEIEMDWVIAVNIRVAPELDTQREHSVFVYTLLAERLVMTDPVYSILCVQQAPQLLHLLGIAERLAFLALDRAELVILGVLDDQRVGLPVGDTDALTDLLNDSADGCSVICHDRLHRPIHHLDAQRANLLAVLNG